MHLPRIILLLVVLLLVPFRSMAADYMDLYPTVTVADFPKAGIPFTFEVDAYNGVVPLQYVNQPGATSVVLSNILPPQLTFVSCSAAGYINSGLFYVGVPPATISNQGGVVWCNLGSLPSGFRRQVYITVMPTLVGTFNNAAGVTGQGGIDYPPSNNYLVTPIQVHSNGLSVVGGQSIPEPSGSNALFQVRLAPPSTQTVTVDFATADGTATAGQDYTPVSGTLVFPPGVTNQNVFVPVLNDNFQEAPSQSFSLRLTNAINAELSGMYEPDYVLDDDPPIQLSISNAPTISEGYLSTNLSFPIHLSHPADVPILFTYSTSGETNVSGLYTNPPGVTNFTLDFHIVGNVTPESNRVLNVTLSGGYLFANPYPSIMIVQSNAQGMVLDDDGAPGDFRSIEISTVPSPQIAGKPFPVYLYAKDSYGNPATNYVSDGVEVDLYRLTNYSSAIIQTVYVSNFVNGVGVAMLTSSNPLPRLIVIAWKPVGEWYTTAITPEFRAIASPQLFLSLGITSATERDGVYPRRRHPHHYQHRLSGCRGAARIIRSFGNLGAIDCDHSCWPNGSRV